MIFSSAQSIFHIDFCSHFRTNTYPKLPERYRLRSSDSYLQGNQQYSTTAVSTTLTTSPSPQQAHRSMSVYGTTSTSKSMQNQSNSQNVQQQIQQMQQQSTHDQTQEEIYF